MRNRFYKVGVLALLVLCAALWLGSDVIKASSGRLLCETLDCSGTVTATGAVTGATFAGGIGGVVMAADSASMASNTDIDHADAVTGLSFTAVEGGQYIARWDVYVASNSTADLKIKVVTPAVSTSSVVGFAAFNGGAFGRFYDGGGGLVVNNVLYNNQIGDDNVVRITATFTTTAGGTVTLRFAQTTSDAVNTKVLAGSCMTWQRVQ